MKTRCLGISSLLSIWARIRLLQKSFSVEPRASAREEVVREGRSGFPEGCWGGEEEEEEGDGEREELDVLRAAPALAAEAEARGASCGAP